MLVLGARTCSPCTISYHIFIASGFFPAFNETSLTRKNLANKKSSLSLCCYGEWPFLPHFAVGARVQRAGVTVQSKVAMNTGRW